MKTWKKVAIIIGVVVVVAGIIIGSVVYSKQGVVQVQTGKVGRGDLTSVVTASGEIKPKTYVNVGANAYGKITKLFVKEGDHVKMGQMLAQIDNVQPESDVQATRAALDAAQTDYTAAQEAYRTAVADLERAKADLEQKSLDWKRGQELYREQLIPKSDYDTRKAAYESSASGLTQAELRIKQTKAQAEGSRKRVDQQQYTLRRFSDVLSKTDYTRALRRRCHQPAGARGRDAW